MQGTSIVIPIRPNFRELRSLNYLELRTYLGTYALVIVATPVPLTADYGITTAKSFFKAVHPALRGKI